MSMKYAENLRNKSENDVYIFDLHLLIKGRNHIINNFHPKR